MKTLLLTCVVGLVVGGAGGCATKPISLIHSPSPEVAFIHPEPQPVPETPPAPPEPALQFHNETWVVRTLRGKVSFAEETGARPPSHVGTRLRPGSSIETGDDGIIDLHMTKVGVVRILPRSSVRLEELSLDETGDVALVKMTLVKGRMMGNARYLGRGSSYVLNYPGGCSDVKGGEFDLTENGAARIESGDARLYFNVKEGGPNSVEVKKNEPILPTQEYIFAEVDSIPADGVPQSVPSSVEPPNGSNPESSFTVHRANQG